MEQVSLVTSMIQAESQAAGSSRSGDGLLRALERSSQRLSELLDVPGVPQQNLTTNLMVEGAELLRQLANAHKTDDLLELQKQSLEKLPSTEVRMLAMVAQGGREMLQLALTVRELERAKLAQRRGYDAKALFEAARQSAVKGGPAWHEVLVLLAGDRLAEGKRRFADLQAAGALPPSIAAVMALRLGEYALASRLFAQLDRDVPAHQLSWSDAGDRAEAALGIGDFPGALQYAENGIRQFEAEIIQMTRDPDRIAAADDIRAASLYLLAARAWLALESDHAQAQSAAFLLIERARSLGSSELFALFNDPSGVARERQHAATEWSSAFDRLLAAHNSIAGIVEDTALHDLEDAEARLLELDAKAERNQTPGKAAAPSVGFDVSAVQRALPRDACLLEYHMLGRDLVGCCVSRSYVTGRHVPLPFRLEGVITRLLTACRSGDAGSEASELAEHILEPFSAELRDCARLFVVPFGPLSTVPFHALPLCGSLLSEPRILSYLPAASMLLRHLVDEPIEGAVLSVGDPAFDPATHPGLRRLPGARIEAAKVAGLYQGEAPLLDADATEAELRGRLAGRTVVRLAAHGRLDDIAPSMSSVILAGRDQLTVADLIGIELKARLVVLSACDTGRGNVTLGGDVVGLARGLFAAGVGMCVVSLWPVDDDLACVTMYEFHRRLANHEPAAAALANAQREIRTLKAAELSARYEALGGKTGEGDRGVRKGESRCDRYIPLDPEFVDAGDDIDEGTVSPDGSRTRVWAPFILIGC
jgi:CHAT domain-containing protein